MLARAMKSGGGACDADGFLTESCRFIGRLRAAEPRSEDQDVYDDDDGDGAPRDWERIGRKALAKSRRVPVMDFMYDCSLHSTVLSVVLTSIR